MLSEVESFIIPANLEIFILHAFLLSSLAIGLLRLRVFTSFLHCPVFGHTDRIFPSHVFPLRIVAFKPDMSLSGVKFYDFLPVIRDVTTPNKTEFAPWCNLKRFGNRAFQYDIIF